MVADTSALADTSRGEPDAGTLDDGATESVADVQPDCVGATIEPVAGAVKEALPDGDPESDGDRDCRTDAELEISAVGDGDPINVAVDRGDAVDEGVTTRGVDVLRSEPLASALDRALGV